MLRGLGESYSVVDFCYLFSEINAFLAYESYFDLNFCFKNISFNYCYVGGY